MDVLFTNKRQVKNYLDNSIYVFDQDTHCMKLVIDKKYVLRLMNLFYLKILISNPLPQNN